MRVRITERPTIDCIDGIHLDRFRPGFEYEVGARLAEFLIVEGWGEPIVSEPAAPQDTHAGARTRGGRRERRSNIIRVGQGPLLA
jgi:hypothetical protein